jgi:hypothetical protein
MGDEYDQWVRTLGVTGFDDIVAIPDAGTGGGGGAATGAGANASQATAAPPTGNSPQDIAQRITAKIRTDTNLTSDIEALSRANMTVILDVLDRLKRAGAFEDFAGCVTTGHERLGAAILTVRGDFDAQWQDLVPRLSAADQQALRARAPASASGGGARPGGSGGTGRGGHGDDDDDDDPDGVISASPDGIEVQAKLTIKSKLAGNLGETEFTVHVGPNGRLSQLELDLTVVKQKLARIGLPAAMLELEGTLSLNATADNAAPLDGPTTRVIFDAVQFQAKAELAAHFTSNRLPLLRNVTFKLTATAGSGGTSITGSIEIPIPGS